jgi:hypothetical protein
VGVAGNCRVPSGAGSFCAVGAGELAAIGVGVDVSCPAGVTPFRAGVATGVVPGGAGVAAGVRLDVSGFVARAGPPGASVGVATEVHAVSMAAERNTDMHQRRFT